MAPKTTLWDLEGHTVGKHRVMAAYLDAWLPIILSSFDRATFVDGFAGPGKYVGGEPGSPIIALDAFRKHRAIPRMTGSLDFVFIDNDQRRVNHLKGEVASLRSSLPDGCDVRVNTGKFTSEMSKLLNAMEAQRRRDEPMFVMIDQFGVSHAPMNIISRILQNARAEVYISVMYEFINRFESTPGFSASMNGLFHTPEWKKALNIDDPTERKDFLYGLYKKQLKEAGAKHVHHFDLYRGNELVYALFFATKNDLGSDRMKQAMWKVDPFGSFEFRSSTRDQMSFGSSLQDPDALGRVLVSEFGLNRQLDIEDIRRFMRSDRTIYPSGQLRDCLNRMEDLSTVAVVEGSRRRRKTYPDGTQIMFVNPPPPEPKQGTFGF